MSSPLGKSPMFRGERRTSILNPDTPNFLMFPCTHCPPLPAQSCLPELPFLSFFLQVVVVLVAKSCPTLATPWTVACQALLSMGFPKQQYWSGLPFPFSRQTCYSSFKTQLNASSSKQSSLPPSGKKAPPPGPVFPDTHLILSWGPAHSRCSVQSAAWVF